MLSGIHTFCDGDDDDDDEQAKSVRAPLTNFGTIQGGFFFGEEIKRRRRWRNEGGSPPKDHGNLLH